MIRHLPRHTPVAELVAAIEADGALIVDDFLTPGALARFNAEIDAPLAARAPNHRNPNAAVAAFHGAKTRHLTGVAAFSDCFVEDILLHPLYAAVADHFLLPECADYRLNLAHVLERGPGAGDQLLHRDEDVWPRALSKAIRERQFASVVALSPFRAETGATRIVPGSHRWPAERVAEPEELVVAEMAAGAAVLYLGRTLHAAGANTTDAPRRGMHLSFCLGWLRAEENNCLAVPLARVRQLPRRAQELLGFGLHDGIAKGEGFLGAVDNGNPLDLIASGELGSR